jgi:capsular exopolysaccharide synthesis family protein
MNGVEAQTPELRDYLKLLRRRGWILLLCVVLIPLATYLYADSRPKVFQSSAVLQVQSTAADGPLLTGQDFGYAQQNTSAIAAFVSTTAVANEAARRLGEPRGSLLGAATATADQETGFVTITATASTAQRAADIANAFASALSAAREKRARKRVDTAIASVEKDLETLGNRTSAARDDLELQLQRLKSLRSAQSQNAQVLEAALPGVKIAPRPRRSATVALILAMLIGAGLMVLAERMDRRLRKPEDLEDLSDQPLLATVPKDAFSGRPAAGHATEAFQALRDGLTYFNVDQPLSSLAVTSALKGEGKTTVAMNLAISYARSGKRVILVDADLRKPDLAHRMGLDDSVGLSEVLVGSSRVGAALREVSLIGPALRVLPAGLVGAQGMSGLPSALLGSDRMSGLLAELAELADLVILDTTPLLVVSDAYPLLDQVSGVVAIARLNETRADAVRRMLQITATAGGRLVGTVATGAETSARYGYGGGYGYGDDRSSGRGKSKARAAKTASGNGGDPAGVQEPERS